MKAARLCTTTAANAYSHPSTREGLRARGIGFTNPERADQIVCRKARGSAGGRPPAFDPEVHARRNIVERYFACLEQFRGLAARYAKRAAYHRAVLIIAAIVLWLREDPQDRPWYGTSADAAVHSGTSLTVVGGKSEWGRPQRGDCGGEYISHQLIGGITRASGERHVPMSGDRRGRHRGTDRPAVGPAGHEGGCGTRRGFDGIDIRKCC